MRFLREIVGHEYIVRTLLNAVSYRRVGHAYLFAGPEGVGKETVALAFARALLCAGPRGGDACGTCRECLQVEHGNHPDLHYAQPDGTSIKIEQIRAIQRRAPYRPYQGGRQVFLVRQAELMTAEAANCLLKTLEEPPGEKIVFILLAERPQALPPTVLSRCQQGFFKGLPVPELSAGLVRLHGLKEEDALLTASLSGGSMGKALAWAAGSFAAGRDTALSLVEELARAGPAEALEIAGRFSEGRDKAAGVLELLSCWYRDLLVYKEAGDGVFLFNPDLVEEIKRDIGGFDSCRLVEILEQIAKAKNKIAANANTRLVLESLFLALSEQGQNLAGR